VNGAASTLEGLRDIHWPGALPPSASADMAAAALAGLALALAAALLWSAALRRRQPLRRAALARLAATRPLAAEDRLAAQADLLRRVVAALEGPAAARERGAAWLARLDRLFGTDFFTAREGQAFGDALYARRPAAAAGRIDEALHGLLLRLRR
jgi:hypothetical protein